MKGNTSLGVVERYLFPSGSKIIVDSNGLLVDTATMLRHRPLIGSADAAKLPGGILMAEGGMGKTTFLERLRERIHDRPVHFFKLGEYFGDSAGFGKDLEAIQSASKKTISQTVLLDGLDEAPDLAGIVLRAMRKLPSSTSVWLASRDVAAVRAIQKERPELMSYSLAPLSRMDLRTLAIQASVDADEFLGSVIRQGLLPICAKPLGCELAISVFRENGLVGVAQRDLWQRGIERLCDETPSQTRQLLRPPKFNLDEVLLCSAWISLCLVLSENRYLWIGEQSHCPQYSLGISDLTSDQFPGDIIRTAAERGAFYPLGDGRVAHSHTIIRDYLAALGIVKFIPAKHWISLLMNDKRDTVFPQFSWIASWLATYDVGFLSKLADVQPELLLYSVDCVQAIGPDRLCEKLLDRADCLSYRQRHDEAIRSNLHRLKNHQTPNVLRACLQDGKAESASIELATAVVEACDYVEFAGVLAERAIDVRLSLRSRVDAAIAVWKLQDDAAKMRLKELLPIDPQEDPYDDLRGSVLRACWPAQLMPDELVAHLTVPQKSNWRGAYDNFLNYDLPASLENSLDENSAAAVLTWAIHHISRYDPNDALGSLARSIYTICWKWTAVPSVAELLARGYVVALSACHSPFMQNRDERDSTRSHVLTREAFEKNFDGRIAVLKKILSNCDIDRKDLGHIPFSEFPLYTQDDLATLFKLVNSDPEGPLVEALAICIKAVLSQSALEIYSVQVDRLNEIRPDLIESSCKLREDREIRVRQAAEWEGKRRQENEDRKKKWSDDQERIDDEFKKALDTKELRPESFVHLFGWLSSENGTKLIPSIDIQHSPVWGKLTVGQQDAMLDLAQRYLTEGKVTPTAPGQHQYAVASALTALRLLRPSVFSGLSCDVWRKCGVELLKATMQDTLEQLGPLLDTLSVQFPDVATDAVLNVLSQELKGDFISIIRNWGQRLSDYQAEAILAIAEAPTTEPGRRFLLLAELARNGKDRLVRTHLHSIFGVGWNKPPDATWHKLRRLAFSLSPFIYIRQLLDSLMADPHWGQEWIESAVGGHDDGLLGALLSCGVDDIAEFYIWLHNLYPPATAPEHEGVYSPSPLDKIHSLKTELINHLTQSGKQGSVAALQMIAARFPSESWITSCVLDAKTAEHANTAPVLCIVQIKELSERKSTFRRLVNSVQDLMEITMETLGAYAIFLQGDTPAVGDLWNTTQTIRPKDEEYFSNHLTRYLDLRLTTDVVINREVQIRSKLFKDGAPGSRTDIWIQATDKIGSVLTLCIEVKCNWNSSAETALKDQLISKYMSGGTATAGVLLLGWFACDSWDREDKRFSASTARWSDSIKASEVLRGQVELEQKNGHNVAAIVLDCGLR